MPRLIVKRSSSPCCPHPTVFHSQPVTPRPLLYCFRRAHEGSAKNARARPRRVSERHSFPDGDLSRPIPLATGRCLIAGGPGAAPVSPERLGGKEVTLFICCLRPPPEPRDTRLLEWNSWPHSVLRLFALDPRERSPTTLSSPSPSSCHNRRGNDRPTTWSPTIAPGV